MPLTQADHLPEGVRGEVGVAGVVEDAGEGFRQPNAFIELADGQQPRVVGKLAW
jgi:hypothetical protein